MTSMNPLGDLPNLVLGPLRGRPDSEWQRGAAGKWTPAQIVEHLALEWSLYEPGYRTPAKRRIEEITAEVEVGRIYDGTVLKLLDFGAIVSVLPASVPSARRTPPRHLVTRWRPSR